MNAWQIVAIDIIVFCVSYKLWLRAEDYEHTGEELSKAEAVFVALVATAYVTAYMVI